MTSGYPAGAVARVRALYELTITARALSRSDEEIAERYSCSHLFEVHRQWTKFGSPYDQLNAEEQMDLDLLEDRRNAAKKRFGPKIDNGNGYSWAAPTSECWPNFAVLLSGSTVMKRLSIMFGAFGCLRAAISERQVTPLLMTG